MQLNLSEKKLCKIGRIDQIVRDYFAEHPELSQIPAGELMQRFIAHGIFFKDYNRSLPIRQLLSQLDAVDKLDLLKHAKAVRNSGNRNWYFVKHL